MSKQPTFVEVRVWDYWRTGESLYMILEFVGADESEQYSNLTLTEGILY